MSWTPKEIQIRGKIVDLFSEIYRLDADEKIKLKEDIVILFNKVFFEEIENKEIEDKKVLNWVV